jgi:hypothetical protein
METEVHIVEKYLQEIKGCFTMTNILLKGRKEIDLLAINPLTGERYHVEVSIWTTEKVPESWLSDDFEKKKFENPLVKHKICELFGNAPYSKALVVWDVKDNKVAGAAKKQFGIDIWFIRDVIQELKQAISNGKIKGSRDDILRVLELVARP